MKPINFSESNSSLLAGNIPNCTDLPVFKDGIEIISKWQLTWKERLSMLIFGTLFVRVLSAQTSPPIALDGRRQIFKEEE